MTWVGVAAEYWNMQSFTVVVLLSHVGVFCQFFLLLNQHLNWLQTRLFNFWRTCTLSSQTVWLWLILATDTGHVVLLEAKITVIRKNYVLINLLNEHSTLFISITIWLLWDAAAFDVLLKLRRLMRFLILSWQLNWLGALVVVGEQFLHSLRFICSEALIGRPDPIVQIDEFLAGARLYYPSKCLLLIMIWVCVCVVFFACFD